VPRAAGGHQYVLTVTPVVVSADIVRSMHENAAERDAVHAAGAAEASAVRPRPRTTRRTKRSARHDRR
jgi:hypothetical protein